MLLINNGDSADTKSPFSTLMISPAVTKHTEGLRNSTFFDINSTFKYTLATTGLKRFNLTALLDFPNDIRPNESNPDSKICQKIIHGVTDVSLGVCNSV